MKLIFTYVVKRKQHFSLPKEIMHFSFSGMRFTPTSSMGNVFRTRINTVDGESRAAAALILNYLQETLPSTMLYHLLAKNLMAWPRLSMTRAVDGNFPRHFGVHP